MGFFAKNASRGLAAAAGALRRNGRRATGSEAVAHRERKSRQIGRESVRVGKTGALSCRLRSYGIFLVRALGYRPAGRGDNLPGGEGGGALRGARTGRVGRWTHVTDNASARRQGDRVRAATSRPRGNPTRRAPRAVIPARARDRVSTKACGCFSRYAPVRGGVAFDDGPRGVRPELGLLLDNRIECGAARERIADRSGRGGLDRYAACVRRSACADAQSGSRESASFAADSLRASAGRRGGRDLPEGVNHGRLHALLWVGYTRGSARVSHAARSARSGYPPERNPSSAEKVLKTRSKDRKVHQRGSRIRRSE